MNTTAADEVSVLVDRLLAEHRQLPEWADQKWRYQRLTTLQALYTQVAAQIADQRARAVVELYSSGNSYSTIAAKIGVSPARAQQMVERGRCGNTDNDFGAVCSLVPGHAPAWRHSGPTPRTSDWRTWGTNPATVKGETTP